MRFYNLNTPTKFVTPKEAVLTGIQGTDGLYMPESIPALPQSFFDNLMDMSLPQIAYEVTKAMLGNDLSDEVIKQITSEAVNFPIPLVQVADNIYALELFHGPTLAFKDVGARFMAGLFEQLLQQDEQQIHILVATSGDTGGAVANAFHNKKNIRVTILYPSGKVSPLQELQLTTLGGNVDALEVEGTFDDCQAMVKQAFADASILNKINLASANSINFARFFPQSFYYFYAYAQLKKLHPDSEVVISVPSGNFGNLTGGLVAKRMGLPVQHYIAANNANDVVKDYLRTGNYAARPSVQTISNAMDVGNPSNFSRMLALYQNNWEAMKADVSGYSYNDDETKKAIAAVLENHNYLCDPHGAVGYLALEEYLDGKPNAKGIFLETAHPCKFSEVVEEVIDMKVAIPESLEAMQGKPQYKQPISADYEQLRNYLLG